MTIAAYRDRPTGRYPVHLAEIRASVSFLFGEEATAEVLDAANVDPVLATDLPSFDPTTHLVVEGQVEWTDNAWRQTWRIVPLPPRPVPDDVTRRQAKIALSRAGLLAGADAAIAGMEGQVGEEARIEWADATVFRRDSPLVLGIGQALGLSADAIDDLFRTAAAI